MLRAPGLVSLLLLLASCDGAPAPGDAGLDAGEDAGACVPPADDPFGCEDLAPDPSCPATWVVGVTGRIQTAAGVGVASARAQLCVRLHPDDALVCLSPPETDADGDFAIVVPEELRCMTRAAMRAIAPRMPLATTYCPMHFEAGDGPIVAIAEPYVLHPVAPAVVPPIGGALGQRDVTFPGGLVLTLAPVDLPMAGDYEALTGGAVDVAATACFAGDLAPDGAYAFDPETTVEAGAAVSIPNAAGLAPGTEVDLYVLGGLETRLIDGTAVEEGVLGRVGPATVSADGAAIVGGPDSRLPYLSWLVWKVR